MDVNETHQWTRLFIPAHVCVCVYIYIILIYFLDIFSIQEYLDLEYPGFCYET
jgi:hypothetical protein